MGVKCNWQESSSIPMETDIDGNLIGFMFRDALRCFEERKIMYNNNPKLSN